MKKLWFVAVLVALVVGIAAVTAVTADTPAVSPDTPEPTTELVADTAEAPIEIPEPLKDTDLFDGESEVVFAVDGCTARKTCPDGCVIACGGNHTCSVGSFSVTCDGRTYTCSGPRLCPF